MFESRHAEVQAPGAGGPEQHLPGTFHQLAVLCDTLAATTRKLEKRGLIASWLAVLTPDDAARAALYLAGQPFAETDSRALNLGGSILSKTVAELSGADAHALGAAFRRHGDLGAAAFDLLQIRAVTQPSLTLVDVEGALSEIAGARGREAKMRRLLSLLDGATAIETKYLIKLALGDMRTGVRQSLIEEAVAAAYAVPAAAVRRALMLQGDLSEVVRMASAGTLDQAQMRLFHALGFMLASPVPTVEEALARFAQEIALEAGAGEEKDGQQVKGGAPVPLRDEQLPEAQIEDKYDGIRCQLHCGDPEHPGRVMLFSRTREDMTAAFPELVAAFASMPEPIIFDGEILAWSPATGRALAFSTLQQRIGRKRVSPELQKQTPVVFMAFDLLYSGGNLLLEQPLHERRTTLEHCVREHRERTAAGFGDHPHQAQTPLFAGGSSAFPRLVLSPATQLGSAGQLDQAYRDARSRGNEGVMLKARNSVYQPGRRGLAWLKLKRELATLDVVVTAAEYGHGRRAAVLSDYTFAVRDGEELRNVGKAYSGLTDAEIEQLTQVFIDQTIEDHGSVRVVEPTIVLEVAFNNVMRSDRHNSGFALRFPRILRIRDDKPLAQIDTLSRVEEIYASQPDKPVELETDT